MTYGTDPWQRLDRSVTDVYPLAAKNSVFLSFLYLVHAIASNREKRNMPAGQRPEPAPAAGEQRQQQQGGGLMGIIQSLGRMVVMYYLFSYFACESSVWVCANHPVLTL